jgi:hypothetical protein
MEEEVHAGTWLCDQDRAIEEHNTETNDGIRPMERPRTKNLSPVAKRIVSTNKVLCADLAREDCKEKTLAVAKTQEFSKMV